MSRRSKVLGISAFLAAAAFAGSANADYWRIRIKPMEQTDRFGSIDYIFKIESFDFLPKNRQDEDNYVKPVNFAGAKAIPGNSEGVDQFYLAERAGQQIKYSYRRLAWVDSQIGEGYPRQCGRFQYRAKVDQTTMGSAIQSRYGVVPSIFMESDGQVYSLGRIRGIAVAEKGYKYEQLVAANEQTLPLLAAYDVLKDATFVYEQPYDMRCRSAVAPIDATPRRGSWSPINAPFIEILSEEEGKTIFDRIIADRKLQVVDAPEMWRVKAFDHVLDSSEYAAFLSQVKEYWRSRYKQEAAAVFNSKNPDPEALRVFASKVPLDQTTRWDNVDYDNLAGKAKKLLDAFNQQQMNKLTAWRKRLAVGDDTFCGPVIEVKSPMIKIAVRPQLQGFGNEAWLKANEVFPQEFGCLNRNGRLYPNQ